MAVKTKTEALHFARQAFRSDRIIFGDHARDESLPDDDMTYDDAYHALDNATDAVREDVNKGKTYGPILNGDEYAIVWETRGRTLFVITSHYPP